MCSMVQYDVVQYGMVQYDMVQYVILVGVVWSVLWYDGIIQ